MYAISKQLRLAYVNNLSLTPTLFAGCGFKTNKGKCKKPIAPKGRRVREGDRCRAASPSTPLQKK